MTTLITVIGGLVGSMVVGTISLKGHTGSMVVGTISLLRDTPPHHLHSLVYGV